MKITSIHIKLTQAIIIKLYNNSHIRKYSKILLQKLMSSTKSIKKNRITKTPCNQMFICSLKINSIIKTKKLNSIMEIKMQMLI